MDYIPHTDQDKKAMLQAIGVDRIEALFGDIPERYLLKQLLDLPAPLSEQETLAVMKATGAANTIPAVTLTGAGAYHHYIPAVVGASRGPLRVLYRLHAVSGGDQPGHPAGDL